MRASDRGKVLWLGAMFGCIVAAATACQALVGFQIEAPVDASAPLTDAGGEGGAEQFDPCGVPPPRPTPRVDDRTKIRPLVFAAYIWGLETPPGRNDLCEQPGFNLDNLDTGPVGSCNENVACKRLEGTLAATQLAPCDEPGGIDNMALRMVSYVRQSSGGGETVIGAIDPGPVVTRGASNILIELTDYNGKERDDSVNVAFYSSAGMDGVDAGGLGIEQIKLLPEIWDGGQDAAWVVSESSVGVESTFAPAKYSFPGYVRGDLLIVPVMQLGFGPPSIFTLGERSTSPGIFMGKLVRKGDRFELTHARFSVTVKSSSLLAAVGRIRNGENQLCTSAEKTRYEFFKSGACGALDMPADAGAPDPNVSCAELSLAFQMAAVESRIARNEDGSMKLGRGYTSYTIDPCPDDAGTVWCDDCAWPTPGRCDAGPQ